MPRPSTIALLLMLAALPAGPARADDDPATLAVDPVELLRGRETAGDEQFAIEHAGFRYVFVTEANRAAFAAAPAKYEIQLGGACARMGPLSGVGTPDLYAVHDGRIYIFASEGCRRGFLERPEKLLEKDDTLPQADTNVATAHGHKLLARALEAAGGAEAVDAVTTYAERASRQVEYEGEPVDTARGLTIDFPDRVRRVQTWGDQEWAEVTVGATGWFESSDGKREMHAQQRRALERIASRNLLVILRARTRDDFVAIFGGTERVDDRKVALLEIGFDGFACTLGIDPETGRIVSQRYLGRGPTREIGVIERRFSDFTTIEGVTLPRTVATRFEGEALEDSPVTLTTLRVARP